MTTFVIDASIAVKWVVEEGNSVEALALRRRAKLIAPELLLAECANILWKKVRRNELSKHEALLAARLLQAADVEFLPTRSLMDVATRAAIELDYPAYDCVYLALAVQQDCRFVTADERLLRKLSEGHRRQFHDRVISLQQAAGDSDKRNQVR